MKVITDTNYSYKNTKNILNLPNITQFLLLIENMNKYDSDHINIEY